MTGSIRSRQESTRYPLSLWGWVMLLVVVLSAAPSGAQPRTRLVGSAFDPAATAVMVSPRQTRMNTSGAVLDARKLPRAEVPNDRAAVAMLAKQVRLSLSALAAKARRDGRPLGIFLLTGAHGPRAPPRARTASAEGRAFL